MQLPEKLRWADDVSEAVCKLGTKINQLIDYLEAKENFHSETKEPMFTENDFITLGNNMLVFNTPELLKAAREALLKLKK